MESVNEEAEESAFYSMSISLSWHQGRMPQGYASGTFPLGYFILSLFAQLGSQGESVVDIMWFFFMPDNNSLQLPFNLLFFCTGQVYGDAIHIQNLAPLLHLSLNAQLISDQGKLQKQSRRIITSNMQHPPLCLSAPSRFYWQFDLVTLTYSLIPKER